MNDVVEARINGQKRNVPAGLNLEELVEHFDQEPGAVVIEHNRQIVRGQQRRQITVQEGDNVEIVQFVGGG